MKRLLPPPPSEATIRPPLKVSLSVLALAALVFSAPASLAQRRAAARPFEGDWNWAVYAESKDELPEAFHGMEIKQAPAYALDITIKQRGNRLRALCGVLWNFLSKVEDCGFDAVVKNNTAVFRLDSSFGGNATVRLTLSGGKLRWKVLRTAGVNYYPGDVTLRRLKRGEKLPYAADEDEQ